MPLLGSLLLALFLVLVSCEEKAVENTDSQQGQQDQQKDQQTGYPSWSPRYPTLQPYYPSYSPPPYPTYQPDYPSYPTYQPQPTEYPYYPSYQPYPTYQPYYPTYQPWYPTPYPTPSGNYPTYQPYYPTEYPSYNYPTYQPYYPTEYPSYNYPTYQPWYPTEYPTDDTGCHIFSSCGPCTMSSWPRCDWCLETKTCIKKNSTGCNNVVKRPQFCPKDPCSMKQNCSACTQFNLGCGWCLGMPVCTMDPRSVCGDDGYVSDSRYCHLKKKREQQTVDKIATDTAQEANEAVSEQVKTSGAEVASEQTERQLKRDD